ncbi:MAG: dienelactone hydrolase family protein [Alphaproteobacteria bacterium]|mgnify:CR=1 FL=1|jgi:dienelactone hydrolase|nr:dienelactone hydrolase family protein [Alphaproteobacteria bacterium]
MRGETFHYEDGSVACEGYVAAVAGKRPCVLIAHQWAGVTDHERAKADELARLGYVGFAIDVYGRGVRGEPMGDNSALMGPYLNDRAKLRQRLLAAVAAAKAHPSVDASRIAVMGYCFGGLCALDVARSGTSDVRGVVSVHGIFPPTGLAPAPIKAKVLVLHGWDDPMAPPKDVLALSQELTAAKADWQLHAYGNAMHAFTAVGVHAPERGIAYNENAHKRSSEAMLSFLKEVFA